MVSNTKQDIFAFTDVPIEKRIAQFADRPNDKECGIALGYGLMGTSGKSLSEDPIAVEVGPKSIPIKLFLIWMYFVLFVVIVIATLSPPAIEERLFFQPFVWGMLIMAAVFIIPTMGAILSWINQVTGSEPYLRWDKSTDILELSRVSKTIPRKQVKEIVFLDRYVEADRYWQVALLVQNQDEWLYIHIFNEVGSRPRFALFGFKDLSEQIADRLEINFRELKFSKKESKTL